MFMESSFSNYENAQSQLGNNDDNIINNNKEKDSIKSNGFNTNQNIIDKNYFNNKVENSGNENNNYNQENNDLNNKNDFEIKKNGKNQAQFEPIFEKDSKKVAYCSKCSCIIF